MLKKISYHPFFIRLLHWEYWPFHVVYGPIYIYWIFLCIKARSFFFINTSNPTIRNGGFLMESKWEIYQLIPQKNYPRTLFFKKNFPATSVVNETQRQQFTYPLYGKPDIGMKGLAVRKLQNEAELREYAAHSKVHFLIQENVPFKNEVGIFYYRIPGESSGKISGIVSKEFLSVKGDGHSSIIQLLKKDKRAILQISNLKKVYGDGLKEILPRGRCVELVPYGNHIRGAKFIDASLRINEQLTKVIDDICKQIDGFYFGRLDLRYNSWDELENGKNFSIVELNGAGSEPTHMYDPAHSIFFAWREIIRHWNILWKISRINHKTSGRAYMKLGSGLRMLRESNRYIHELKTASKGV